MSRGELDIRVYYEDTDAGGIVYYANYLRFCERGRTEYLRSIGFQNTSLKDEKGLLFVVRRLEADYHSPARLDDVLTVRTLVSEAGKTSFMMEQEVVRGGQALFTMAVQLVCVNMNGRPVRVPDDLKEALGRK